jgi:hypothetical protein
MKSCGSKQWSNVKWHVALRRIQHKKFRPRKTEESNLVGDLKLGKSRDVSAPLDSTEKKPSCKFTDVVDANHVTGRWRGRR